MVRPEHIGLAGRQFVSRLSKEVWAFGGSNRSVKVYTRNSLWASFARAKYYVGNNCTIPNTSFPLWRSIARHGPRLLSLSRWIIGDGSISFWTANWCGVILYGPAPCDNKLTVAQDVQIQDEMRDVIPVYHQSNFCQSRFCLTLKIIWYLLLRSPGEFSTKVYLEVTRNGGAVVFGDLFLPLKISTFVWKLLHRAVPSTFIYSVRSCAVGLEMFWCYFPDAIPLLVYSESHCPLDPEPTPPA